MLNKNIPIATFRIWLSYPRVACRRKRSATRELNIGEKVSIISSVPQTTRYQVRGILNFPGAQVVFIDTPGMHMFKDDLVAQLNSVAKAALCGCELILYVADTSRPVGKEEKKITGILREQPVKVIMVLNKMDLGGKFVDDYIGLWQETRVGGNSSNLLYYLPVSAGTGKNVDKLKELILENLPEQPAFYDKDTITDFPLKFRIADIVREKLFLRLREDLPHSIAVEVEEIEEKEKVTHIIATIYVKRQSQKRIVVGAKGAMIKKVGQEARQDIEKIIKRQAYLDLWVKVTPDWQKKPRILQELGYL